MSLSIDIDPSDKEIAYWPYRTATVTDRIITGEYDTGDEWDKLQKELHLKRKSPHACPDNHECFTIRYHFGQQLHIQFSDWRFYVGLSIRRNG